jgi:hypothetical protein
MMDEILNNTLNEVCSAIVEIDQLSKNILDAKKDHDAGNPRRAYMDHTFDQLYSNELVRLQELQSKVNSYFTKLI